MAVMEVDIAKIVPQADRVLVRLEKLADQSSGGVLLPPASVKFERYLVGEVIAAGTEVENVGKGQKVCIGN
jgi:chaperonin GroES